MRLEAERQDATHPVVRHRIFGHRPDRQAARVAPDPRPDGPRPGRDSSLRVELGFLPAFHHRSSPSSEGQYLPAIHSGKDVSMRSTSRRHPGFTLIELLVVIAIIAVLIALLLP